MAMWDQDHIFNSMMMYTVLETHQETLRQVKEIERETKTYVRKLNLPPFYEIDNEALEKMTEVIHDAADQMEELRKNDPWF